MTSGSSTRYGQDAALDLLPAVRQLAKEFYGSDAHYFAANLSEMGRQAEVRNEEWPGAGSNCRPTAFQAVARTN
jgi:hypothetical protein